MSFDGPAFIRHVAERLVLEFQFSQGAGTPGLIGAAKEHPARVQLERLMPGGVGIGSGIVVDSFGAVSRQQDVVIYEKLCPVFTHNDAAEATYFPIEGVIAVGEVKSRLGKAELNDAVAKSESVKRLRRRAERADNGFGAMAVSFRPYCSVSSFAGSPSEDFDQDTKSLDQVYSFVLCQKFSASPETTLKNFVDQCRAVGSYHAPNMIVSLDEGGIYPYNSKSKFTHKSAGRWGWCHIL
jgi:hypothetical protein